MLLLIDFQVCKRSIQRERDVLNRIDVWIKFWTSAVAAHGNSVNGLYLGILLGVEVLAMSTIICLVRASFPFRSTWCQ